MSRPRTFDEAAVARRAMEMFWERGFGSTGAAAISSHLGLGMGSIYRAYGSKEGLFLAALREYRQRNAEILETTLGGDGSARERVRHYLVGRVEDALADPLRRGCLLVNTIGECLPHDTAAAEFAASMQESTRDAIAATLAAAVDDGELPPDTETTALADYLVTVLNGAMVAVKIGTEGTVLRRSLDVALRALDAPAT